MRHVLVECVLLAVAAASLVGCETTSASRERADAAAAANHGVQSASLGAHDMALADGKVYLGGQPSRADLAAAARYPGIESVLDLRRESENRGFDEAAELDRLDIEYENVPVGGPDQLTDEALDESLRIIRTSEKPLLVHCASGNRVGAVWMAWRMLEDGYTAERAEAEARLAGLRNDEFIPVVLDYVQRRRAAPDRQ